MSRGRLTPSLNYRNKEFIDMHISSISLRNMAGIEVACASNLNDAQSSPSLLFFVPFDNTFYKTFI